MQHHLEQSDIAARVQELIDTRFRGNMSEMGRACQEYNDRIRRGHISSIIDRGSMPRADIVAVIALASGVTSDWILGIEKPRKENPAGAGLVREAHGYNPRSVKFEPLPSDSVLPGFAIGAPGKEQLTIDFVVRGRESRHTIPFQEHRSDVNDE